MAGHGRGQRLVSVGGRTAPLARCRPPAGQRLRRHWGRGEMRGSAPSSPGSCRAPSRRPVRGGQAPGRREPVHPQMGQAAAPRRPARPPGSPAHRRLQAGRAPPAGGQVRSTWSSTPGRARWPRSPPSSTWRMTSRRAASAPTTAPSTSASGGPATAGPWRRRRFRRHKPSPDHSGYATSTWTAPTLSVGSNPQAESTCPHRLSRRVRLGLWTTTSTPPGRALLSPSGGLASSREVRRPASALRSSRAPGQGVTRSRPGGPTA